MFWYTIGEINNKFQKFTIKNQFDALKTLILGWSSTKLGETQAYKHHHRTQKETHKKTNFSQGIKHKIKEQA